jgi:SAM-dependent methyltransferase
MRDNVRAFAATAAQAFQPRGPIYEFGSYLVAGQEQLANLRPLFPGQQYIGCDMRPGAGVDRVEDLAELQIPDSTAAAVICLDTLEHVFEIRKAVDEMLRVLKPGGMILISAPLDFRIHHHPDDYWRLTPSCVARLLAPLAANMVGSQGVEGHPHTVFGLGFKAPVPVSFPERSQLLLETFQNWCETQRRTEPVLKKSKRWLTSLVRSKGERRRLKNEFTSRFVVQFGASSWNDAHSMLEGLVSR